MAYSAAHSTAVFYSNLFAYTATNATANSISNACAAAFAVYFTDLNTGAFAYRTTHTAPVTAAVTATVAYSYAAT